MANGRALGCFVAATAAMIWSGGASGSSDVVEKVQTHLYTGRTVEAAAVAQERLVEDPADDQARFALGVAQFLQAVEHLGQSLHRYGLRSMERRLFFPDLTELPILRIPVPENPHPERLTYEKLRGVLIAFVQDLETAEATLGSVEDQSIDLPLNIGRIRLDLNEDGQASDEEALWHIFRVVAEAAWLDEQTARQLRTDFDGSDVPWLQAYCHLLMALAEFPLAHDWQDAFEATFHGPFPSAEVLSSVLAEEDAKAAAELEMLGEAPHFRYGQYGFDEEGRVMDREQWLETPEGRKWIQVNRLRQRLGMSGTADLIAFIHLNHWPVVEPPRMKSILGHLETMVRLSRENWRRIMDETDDRNEWIPNPKQSGVLPRMRITLELVEGWQRFLDEFEALLQGKRLLPHWRFEQGVNLRRIFLEPTTFDIVLLLQGSAAIRYLEDGELSTGETWSQITDIFGGDFFRYFVWFN